MIFTENVNQNYYAATLGHTPNGHADAIVKTGGERVSKFVPNINASKWDDEAWININNKAVEVKSETQDFKDGKVDLIVGNDCHRYYIDDDGNLEYEIIFSSHPKPEILLDLQFSSGLAFYYQPPLDGDEIKRALEMGLDPLDARPENVIGSYAIYHGKSCNQYQTGKFAHIYRPLFIDAKGYRTWGELFIDPAASIISIRCDEKWLSDAAYPVTLDPTFGWSTVGGSNDTDNAYPNVAKAASTPASDGTLTGISFYCALQSNATNFCTALYSDSSGSPYTRYAVNETGAAVGASYAWVEASISYAGITAGTQYWLGHRSSINTNYIKYKYDTVSNGAKYKPGSSFPDPWDGTSWVNQKQSIYATYTEASSGQPASRRFGSVPFVGLNRGIW